MKVGGMPNDVLRVVQWTTGNVAAEAGTNAMPMPVRTSTSIVCTCVTYCSGFSRLQ